MNENVLVASEKYGLQGNSIKYVKTDGQDNITVLQPPKRRFASLSQLFMTIFLPQGFPESVSQDYLVYQLWDTIQAFASSITSTLATQSILKGIGVGDESATPIAATVTWLLKDGAGMLGRIVFAWFEGSDLDYNCKRWRLYADILNDLSIFLNLMAPWNGAMFFIHIVCVSSLCKALVGVAGGATRAAIVQHQSRRDNLGDVSAKDGSQETLVNLAALVCSLVFIPAIGNKEMLVWMLFFIFTFVHLFANYKAVKSIVMESLNMARFYIVVQHYLLSGGEVLSTKDANYQEPVLVAHRGPLKINLGCSLKKIFSDYRELRRLNSLHEEAFYLLQINNKKGEIDVALHEGSDSKIYLQAVFQAAIISFCYENTFKGSMRLPFPQLEQITAEFETGSPRTEAVIRLSHIFTQIEFPAFYDRVAAAGWDVRKSLLGPDEWRCVWNPDGLDYERLHHNYSSLTYSHFKDEF